MEKSRIDLSPYLLPGEKTIIKSHALKSKAVYVETGLCVLLWFLTIAGDCFLVGYAYSIKNMNVVKDIAWFLPIFIALVAVHLVPLGMWIVSLSAKATANSEKWFVLTDMRVISVSGGVPAVLSFVKLSDVIGVKSSKKYVQITLTQGRYFKVFGIENALEFSDALEAELDKLFDSPTVAEGQEELEENAVQAQNAEQGDAVEQAPSSGEGEE